MTILVENVSTLSVPPNHAERHGNIQNDNFII